MRLLLSLLLTFGLSTAVMAAGHAPEGQTILTVGGDLPDPNAPGGSADDVAFLGHLDIDFASGYAFDFEALSALDQHQITATLTVSDTPVTWSGPRLSDVLTMAGAQGRTTYPTALDGYRPELSWDLIETHQPILALRGDGVPLALGGIGPTMIVFPVVEDAELYAGFDAFQVWALFFIGVE